MSRPTLIRFLLCCIIVLLGLSAGTYAYSFPQSIKDASRPAITALSIIFGLSTAISSVVGATLSDKHTSSNDPALAASQRIKARTDDNRTLSRLTILYQITLLTIITGIIYLVASDDSNCSQSTRILAFLFAAGMTVSLFSALFLPGLLTSTIKRNKYLQRLKSSEK